jgi:hypothetical protein
VVGRYRAAAGRAAGKSPRSSYLTDWQP